VPQQAGESSAISAQIIPDTPTAEYVAQPTTAAASVPSGVVTGSGEHWIDVNLSEQRLYAYEGDTLVNSFIVSTGTWQTPTVTGSYKIWIKLRSAAMSGPGYYLPDVPYIMYFYKDYGLHGTYWHNNFGTPMSHGCVNLSIPDAEWVYNFTQVGTVVNVHY
jgi:lipoprotein-anchoring transpeptidase ErfK/SrfK